MVVLTVVFLAVGPVVPTPLPLLMRQLRFGSPVLILPPVLTWVLVLVLCTTHLPFLGSPMLPLVSPSQMYLQISLRLVSFLSAAVPILSAAVTILSVAVFFLSAVFLLNGVPLDLFQLGGIPLPATVMPSPLGGPLLLRLAIPFLFRVRPPFPTGPLLSQMQ